MITTKDVKFILLVELPNENVHQVIIDEEYLKLAVENYGKFTVIEDPIKEIKIKK